MRRFLLSVLVTILSQVSASELAPAIERDYEAHLGALFTWFHNNPELSLMEFETSKRLARELREAGYDVTEGVGGTGVVAILRNGPGPTVMMRADMDALPVEDKTEGGVRVRGTDWHGNEVWVSHACGHDVHVTSLVGTARQMARLRDQWSGTLMLIGQPAEEGFRGAKRMRDDRLWDRFGKPDYALAFHVTAGFPAGKLWVTPGATYSGADSVDITIHGVGGHGAAAHYAIDPIVLGSQIVMALQTVVSRSLPPREPGVITVGSFHSGTKHNIIPDRADLQLTVRHDSTEARELLLSGIRRVSEGMGRVAGLPEDKLPVVTVADGGYPPTINDVALTERLIGSWRQAFGEDIFHDTKRLHMGAEDFGFFTKDPYIPSTYFAVGGSPQEDLDAGPVAGHHSTLFEVDAEASITLGVEATVVALIDLMPPR